MIEIKNLNAGYGENHVLKNITLRIEEGTIVSIIGPNGAGKSTLLNSIFNLCDIYSGDIIFNNKKITKIATHKLISEGINYCPQKNRIFSDMTVYENLELGLFQSKEPEKKKKEKIKNVRGISCIKTKKRDACKHTFWWSATNPCYC